MFWRQIEEQSRIGQELEKKFFFKKLISWKNILNDDLKLKGLTAARDEGAGEVGWSAAKRLWLWSEERHNRIYSSVEISGHMRDRK